MPAVDCRLSMLPIRPGMEKDEWTESYLGRVARANGLRRPWRDDLERIRVRIIHTPDTCNLGVPMYGGEPLPSWATLGRAAQIAYCPACLHEARYVRARWRLAQFEACTVHDLRLKPGLCEPAVTHLYKRPDKREVHDITDDEIWAGAECPLPLERAYSYAIWAEFEQAVTRSRPEDAIDPLAWALLSERLLDAVVTAVRGPGYPPKNVPRLGHRARWLFDAGLEISASHEGVLGFLLSLKVNAHRRAAATCLLSLVDEEVRQRTVLSRLPLQYLHDRLLAAAPEAQHLQNQGALPATLRPTGYVNLEQAEYLLGCSPGLLYFLMRERFFTKVEKIRFGRRQYVFIHRSEVDACRRWLSSCMTFEQVVETLQIDRPAYLALLDSGLLNPFELGSWRRYRREEILGLTSRLDSISHACPANAGHLEPLMGGWLRRRGRPRSLVTKILKEIVDGQLPLYRKPEERGLCAYYVDRSAIMRLRWLADVCHADRARATRCAGQLSLLDAP